MNILQIVGAIIEQFCIKNTQQRTAFCNRGSLGGAGYIAGCVRKKGHRYQIAAQRGGRQFARNCGKYISKMCIKNNEFWIIILTIKICIKLCIVWKVLTDFAVYDWWHYGKALCDKKFSKIEGNGRIFSHSVTTKSVGMCKIWILVILLITPRQAWLPTNISFR